MQIPGGRVLAAAVDLTGQTMHWVTCHVEDLGADPTGLAGRRQRLLDEPADVPIFGTSLALVLQSILDGGDLTGLETGRLVDLDTAARQGESVDTHTPEPEPGHPVSEPGPDAGLDEIRAAKEAAIDQRHYELADRLRVREKALLQEQADRRRTDQSEAWPSHALGVPA